MKKTYLLEDLECAHCAAKMEEEIAKLDGVISIRVNFLAQKMILEAEDSRFDDVLKETVKICRRIEPDCTIIL